MTEVTEDKSAYGNAIRGVLFYPLEQDENRLKMGKSLSLKCSKNIVDYK
jgi:hypothetical protein